MSRLKYLTIITGIVSFYFYIWVIFNVMLKLGLKLLNLRFFSKLPEFIGAGTFIILFGIGLVLIGAILVVLNIIIYNYFENEKDK